MNIRGFKIVESFGGVSVAEVASVEVDTWEALDLRMYSVDSGWACSGSLPIGGPRCRGDEDEKDPLRFRPGRFTYKAGDGARREVKGAIFYKSVHDLVAFFLERYDESGATLFDESVRTARGGGDAERTQFERFLTHEQDQHEIPFLFGREKRQKLTERIQLKSPMPILDHWQFCRKSGAIFHLPGGEYAILQTEDDLPTVVVWPVAVKVSGRDIPRWRVIIPQRGWRDPESGAEVTRYLYFDGETHSWHAKLCEIGEGLREDMDRCGIPLPDLSADFFPQGHLRARCLVRIPPASEMPDPATFQDASGLPPHAALARPALVRPGWTPVALERDLPILDSPEFAAFLLARTVRGIFVAEAEPAPLYARFFGEKAEYLILCDPEVVRCA